MSEKQNTPNQVRLPLVLCLGLAAGVFIGASFNSRKTTTDVNKDVQRLREVLTKIKEDYVDTVSTATLVDEAIQHLLNKLDPHSSYIPASDTEAANEDLRGNFDGIGIEFNIFNDTVNVLYVVPDGPSDKAGLQVGDRILKVGDSAITDQNLGLCEWFSLLVEHMNFDRALLVLRLRSRWRFVLPVARVVRPRAQLASPHNRGDN